MTKNPKKRLCWNCEGSVLATAEICPFCGVSVVPASLDSPVQHFAPSYTPGNSQEFAIPKPPYAHDEKPSSDETHSKSKENDDAEINLDSFNHSLMAVAMLLTGSVFFLFGIVLVLFSNNGVLTLQWDGSLWYIYTIISIPLLFFGWKYLLKLD